MSALDDRNKKTATMNDLARGKTSRGTRSSADSHLPKKQVFMGGANTYKKTDSGIILSGHEKGTIYDKDGKVVESAIGVEQDSEKADVMAAAYLADMEKQREAQDKIQAERESYNEALEELDPKYSEQIEFVGNEVLVRLRKLDYIDESGLVRRSQIELPNKSGTGMGKLIDDPYPYGMIGVVVNTGHLVNNFTTGDIVQVHPLVAQSFFERESQQFILKNGFYRWDDTDDFSGYFLITSRDIYCKIKDYN